jgi:uncharacterized protein (TIGR02147 family)
MDNIFEYTDYRTLVEDFYQAMKKQNPKYSYAVFSREAHLPSRTYIKLVTGGKRNLTMKTIPKFSKAMKLNIKEAAFFENLVLFNQAADIHEKDKYYLRLLSFEKREKAYPLEKDQYLYYSEWYIPIVRELAVTRNFKADSEWISKKIRITKKQARRALDVLRKLKILDERYKPKHTNVESTDEVRNLALNKFNRQLTEKALTAFNDAVHMRELSSLSLALTEDEFRQIKSWVKQSRSELNQKFSKQNGAHDVYQLNFQLFCLTKKEIKI